MSSHLADNVAHFARALRAAGVRVGPADTLAAIEALRLAGLERRDDTKATLRATLLSRHEDEAVFAECFERFFRARNLQERLISILSPQAPPRPAPQTQRPGARRADEALSEMERERPRPPAQKPEIEIDARLTASQDDLLRGRDFAQMTARELDEARRAVAALTLPDDRVATRRLAVAVRGRIDLGATLRRSLRTGGDLMLPVHRTPRWRSPPIVVLADISGSMSRYSEFVLRFAHALTEHRRTVSTFLFGTRLTNVTRAMRHRDPDEALAACSHAVRDWSGGTRIGAALGRFNRDWSRRVLGQRATVLLVTDGLELGPVDELSEEAGRLARSCRRLVWLSPLLGFEGFAPKARGVRALLAEVDEFRPVHSIEAIEDLCRALGSKGRFDGDPRRWRKETT